MIQAREQGRDDRVVSTVASYFDDLAPIWSRNYAPRGSMEDRIERFAEALSKAGLRLNAHVLDFGCGTGTIAGALAGKGYKLTGCDISREMISIARAAYPTAGITWVVLDPSEVELPFDQGEYDAVIASSVLEYVQDPAPVLSQFRRVMAPGGVLICTVPDERHPLRVAERNWLAAAQRPLPRLLLHCLPRFVPQRRRYDYLRLSRTRWSASEWVQAFARQGFEVPVVGDCVDPLMMVCASSPTNV